MSELALECLTAEGVRSVVVANRTEARAQELATRFGGTAARFDALGAALSEADIVVTATAAPHPVITRELFDRVLPRGPKRPLLVVDIAIPRDVEPAVGEVDNVFLYDIDDLRQIVDDNLERRRAEIPVAERIVDEALDAFWSWYVSRDVVPVIRELREAAEALRRREVEKALRRLSHLGPDDQAMVDRLTRQILNKILHRPTVRLREAASRGNGEAVVHAARYLFELDTVRGELEREGENEPEKSAGHGRRRLHRSHVADAYLADGHEVIGVDDLSSGKRENVPSGATFVQMDISDPALEDVFRDAGGFDIVNHHAAQMDVRRSVADPRFDARINIDGLLNVLELARRFETRRVLFVSSGGVVYGEPEVMPTPESAPKLPLSPYGVTKLAAEFYLHYYRRVHGLESVALRYSNVYGPRQDPHGEAGVVAIFSTRSDQRRGRHDLRRRRADATTSTSATSSANMPADRAARRRRGAGRVFVQRGPGSRRRSTSSRAR